MKDMSKMRFSLLPGLVMLSLGLTACSDEPTGQTLSTNDTLPGEKLVEPGMADDGLATPLPLLQPAEEILPNGPKTPSDGTLARPGVRVPVVTTPSSATLPSPTAPPAAKSSQSTNVADEHNGHDMQDMSDRAMSDHDMSEM